MALLDLPSEPRHDDGMAWQHPHYSRSAVDRAGDVLAGRSDGQRDLALEIINNWRASHSYPLNTFQMGLRQRARRVDPNVLIAQRIKRLASITAKLENEPSMQLSQMQDIGGCRAILPNVAEVRAVRELYRYSRNHHLVREKDYVSHPKVSGYRSVHLVYRYFSNKKPKYNGLQVEIQLRSQLQHAWATAVETVGTFLQQSLKASHGPDEWLEFFVLMASAIAALEDAPLVPGTPPSHTQLIRELKQHARALDVTNMLQAYHATLPLLSVPEARRNKYFLVELRPAEQKVNVRGFREKDLTVATDQYLRVERGLTGPGAEAVLVSVQSLDALRRAYPNYFLDTQVFLETLHGLIS